MTYTSFSFLTTLLVLGDTGRFLKVTSKILGLGLDQVTDHALLDNRVASRTQTCAQEQISNVFPSAFLVVQEIARLGITGNDPFHGDFTIRGKFAGQPALCIVEHQLNASLPYRLARVGTIEDDVRHRFTTQRLCRRFPHHPAHSINDVRFSAAIRANNGTKVRGKGDCCRVYK